MNACFSNLHRHNDTTSALSAKAVASVCVRNEMDSVCLTGSIFAIISIIIELVIIINSHLRPLF